VKKDNNLYQLQLIDSAIDKLNKRKQTIPEQKELSELEEKIKKLTALINTENSLLSEAETEQKHLEDELSLLEAKIKREESRLYGGEVTNPKELKSLQSEVKALKDKRDGQEDALLAAIERTDKISGELNKLNQAEADFNKKADLLRDKLQSIGRDIDNDIENEEQKKNALISKISADLLELYKKLRREKRGIAVAKLDGLTCLGCHMEMPEQKNIGMRLEEIWRCPNCRRILIEN